MRLCRLLVSCCIGLPTAGLAQNISVTAATSYLEGRFGGATATKASVSFAVLQGDFSGFQLAATLPYLSVKSGGQFAEVGGILVPSDGSRVSGLGDVILNVERPLPLGENASITVTPSGFVKVPTGSRSISTGQVDGGVNLEVSKTFGKVSPFLKLGYRFYGDGPELQLQDGWAASTGATFNLGKLVAVASYDWEESSFGGPSSKELYGLVNGPFARRFRWTLFGSKGLSQGAADTRVGAALTLSFGDGPARIMPRRQVR